jgi:hypothetical protein
MTIQRPAEFYAPCNDLWVITTYYNPAGYRTKRQNYERFAAPLRAAEIPLVTVECAFGVEPFELDSAPHIIRVRGRDVMWLKERLINLAVSQLPPSAEKVAWLDGDILMSNHDWAIQTAAQLDRWPVVQPCESILRLDCNQNIYDGAVRRSFACQLHARPESACLGASAHGQPGIAWAARRSLIKKRGLYDAAILDGGDELFSHALGGGFDSSCVRGITGARHIEWPWLINLLLNRLLRLPWPRLLAEKYVRRAVARKIRCTPDETFYAHYLNWAQKLYADVRGQMGYVQGMALHLWHGDPVNRQYSARNAILKRHCFDPATDLRLNADGVWEWASDKPLLHQEVRNYFYSRREDE